MASKAAFRDFLDRYAGVDTEWKNPLETMMVKAYEDAYNATLVEINKARKQVDYASYARQTETLKKIGEILDRFKGRSAKYLNKALAETAKYATHTAIKDLETLGKGLTRSTEWHKEYNEKYVEKVFTDNWEHIAGQTDKMKKAVKTQLRSDAAAIFRRAAVEGMTRRETTKSMMEEVGKNNPSFVFTDKAGRNWDNRKYFEMLGRTVLHNTRRECYANTLTNEGQDLVKITVQGAKDACQRWEGRIVSLTGATKGYPTMADAIASKEVFHPRCLELPRFGGHLISMERKEFYNAQKSSPVSPGVPPADGGTR